MITNTKGPGNPEYLCWLTGSDQTGPISALEYIYIYIVLCIIILCVVYFCHVHVYFFIFIHSIIVSFIKHVGLKTPPPVIRFESIFLKQQYTKRKSKWNKLRLKEKQQLPLHQSLFSTPCCYSHNQVCHTKITIQ